MRTSKIKDEKQFLHVEEVAKVLRTSSRTIYRWLSSGKISGKKIGRSWCIPQQVVSDLIDDAIENGVVGAQKTPSFFSQGEHLFALAPEREAVAGMMVKFVEMGLQHRYHVFAGCWPFSPDELRGLMRTLGIPTDTLETEGTLTISDFNAVFNADGAEGILQKWRDLVDLSQRDNTPLLAIGAPSLDCWSTNPEGLIEFEKTLNELWCATSAVSICIYPLADFVPERLRRIGTLINNHTGVLLWSETEMMLFRPDEFSQMFHTPNLAAI